MCVLCVAGPVVSFPDNNIVNLGSDLTLECDIVSSDPPLINVSITLNGRLLATGTNEPLEYTVLRPQLNNTGDIYECIAINEIDTTIEKFALTVRGKRKLYTVCVSEWPPLPPSSQMSLGQWTVAQWSLV